MVRHTSTENGRDTASTGNGARNGCDEDRRALDLQRRNITRYTVYKVDTFYTMPWE